MTDKANHNDDDLTLTSIDDDVIDWQDLSRPSFIPKRKSSSIKTNQRKRSDKMFFEYQQCFLSNEGASANENSNKSLTYKANHSKNTLHLSEQHHSTSSVLKVTETGESSIEQSSTTNEFYVISDNLPTLDEYESRDIINTSTFLDDQVSLTKDITQVIERYVGNLKIDKKNSLHQSIVKLIMASKQCQK